MAARRSRPDPFIIGVGRPWRKSSQIRRMSRKSRCRNFHSPSSEPWKIVSVMFESGVKFRLSRPAFVGSCLFCFERRRCSPRRGHLAHNLFTHASKAGRGVGSHRLRENNHLRKQVLLPDRRRIHRASRRRRPDGVARDATASACRRGFVQRGSQAAIAVFASRDWGCHVAQRIGDLRHSPSTCRPFSLSRVLWPVRVQGDNSAQEIAAAIRGFNALTEDMAPVVRPMC